MKRLTRQFAGPALMLVAVIVAVIFLARGASGVSWRSLQPNLALMLLASLLVGVGQLVSALVWRQIVQAFGVRQPAREDLRIYFYSAVSVAIPGSIWVMASRSAFYARAGASALRVAFATTLESLIVGIAGIAIYAVTVLAQPGAKLWQQPLLGIACAALSLVLIQPRIFNALYRRALVWGRQPADAIGEGFGAIRLAQWLVTEALVVMVAGVVYFLLLRSVIFVPIEVLVPVAAAWAAAVAAGNLFFFLPGTSVLRSGAMVLALTPVLGAPFAILFAALSHVWSLATLLLNSGIVWLVLDLPAYRRKRASDRKFNPYVVLTWHPV